MERKEPKLKVVNGGKADPSPEMSEEERQEAQEEFDMGAIYEGFGDAEKRKESRKLIEEVIDKKIPTDRISPEKITPDTEEWFRKEFGDPAKEKMDKDLTIDPAIELLQTGESIYTTPASAVSFFLLFEAKFNKEVVERAIELKQKAIDQEAVRLAIESINKEKTEALVKQEQTGAISEYLKEKDPAKYEKNLQKFKEEWEKRLRAAIAAQKEQSEDEKKRVAVEIKTLANNLLEEREGLNVQERQAVKESAVKIWKEQVKRAEQTAA